MTDDLAQRVERLERSRSWPSFAETYPPSPPDPGPETFSGKWAAAQAAKRARLAQEAEIERVRLEREAAAKEAERRAQWEAHRPQREAAVKELAKLTSERASLDQRREALLSQIHEQREIARRFEK